ncbi:unnamed protein product [Sphagnum balticum]
MMKRYADTPPSPAFPQEQKWARQEEEGLRSLNKSKSGLIYNPPASYSPISYLEQGSYQRSANYDFSASSKALPNSGSRVNGSGVGGSTKENILRRA